MNHSILLIIIVIGIPFCHLESTISNAIDDPIVDMIHKEHYPIETHSIQTKDGYLLTVHRIPNVDVERNNRKIILLMHGISDSAEAFLSNRHGKSFAYELYKRGFDVWMPNARGNSYSRQHMSMKPTDAKFWNFSWHEIGIYDIPATIDHILKTTNQSKLAFVGVSQGVTALFVTLSEYPEYNDAISNFIALAPVVILKYTTVPIPRSVELMNILGNFLQSGGLNDLTPHSMSTLIQSIVPMCMTPYGRQICRNFVFTFFGPSVQYFDGMLMNITKHYPAGSSYKQFIHFGQNMATGKFQKFHYDAAKNIEMYGTSIAPEYNLTKITTQVHLFYGTNDRIAPAKNIPLIVKKLGKKPTVYRFLGFNHIDFTYGKNLKLVHQKVFKILGKT